MSLELKIMSSELSDLEELRKLAEQGLSCAQYELGEIYYEGKLVEKNIPAIKEAKEACERSRKG